MNTSGIFILAVAFVGCGFGMGGILAQHQEAPKIEAAETRAKTCEARLDKCERNHCTEHDAFRKRCEERGGVFHEGSPGLWGPECGLGPERLP